MTPSDQQGYWVGCMKNGLYHFDRTTRVFMRINDVPINGPVSFLYRQGDSVLWASSVTTFYKIDTRSRKIVKKTRVGKTIQS